MELKPDAERPPFVLSVLNALEPGGVERVILRSTKAWRERGLDARIALGRWEGSLRAEAPDVPFIIMGGRRRFETLWLMLKLPGTIRRLRPDVVLLPMNGMMSVAAVVALILGKNRPPLIMRISNSLHRPEMGRIHRFFHRLSMRIHSHVYAAIVTTSPPMRPQVIHEMDATPEQVVVIDNVSMTASVAKSLAQARDAHSRARKGRHFFAAGRLMPQKNFELLLDAFARIAQPDDRLTIIGEGPKRKALERRAAALGITGQLALPGHQIDIVPWFAQADAFVLSSDFEGFGNVIAEALAAALPIVATDCCLAIPMLIENVGRLVPIRDVDALASAMDAICDDPVPVAEMRSRAARFTDEATAVEWLSLFYRLAGHTRLPA